MGSELACEMAARAYNLRMEKVGRILPPKFDGSDPVVRANPYPTYARLRESARLCRGGPGQWVVTRYADVAALLGDRRLRNQFPAEYHRWAAGSGLAGEFLQRIVLHQDDEKHKSLRRLLARGFQPGALAGLLDHIGRLVDGLIAPALDSGFLDGACDLAFPLPMMVLCHILGVPSQDHAELRRRVSELGRAFASSVGDEDRAAADGAVAWLRTYAADLLKQRLRNPGNDLVSRMLAADWCQGRGEEEFVDNVVFLFFAGFETTSSLIATGCVALSGHAEQLARLRADPTLVPTAVEEFLRYDAPIQSRLRFVQEPVEIEGRVIKPGRLLLLLLGSANHDERQFSRPEELDVTRTPNPHLGFGGGDHYCLGAGLARLESTVVFERLLRHFSYLEPAGEPVRDASSPFRIYRRVPIAVRGAGRP
jgi:cytochrome P450